MPVDDNGVYIPETIEQINSDLQEQLIASGVDLNVFDNSNYIQTTNPIVTKIYNLQVNIASFPDQIQKIFQLQNIEITRAGILTADSILNSLLNDPDIDKADVRNFNPGEVTLYVWSSTTDLLLKDYTDLTNEIVPNTSVWGIFINDGGAPSGSAFRANSQQQTTVYYNVATEVNIIVSDNNNKLTINVTTFNPVDTGIESDKIDAKLVEVFGNFKIGQDVEPTFIANQVFEVGNGNYSSVDVTFTGTSPVGAGSIYIYTSSEIVIM